jgi:lysophospholipase L1-like esterase
MRSGIFGGIAATTLLVLGSSAAFAQAPAQTPSAALPTVTMEATALPVIVRPTNPQIRYEGRFDRTDPAGPRCSWSASEVTLKFRGAALNVVLHESDNNDEYEIVTDGQPSAVLIPQSGTNLYSIFSGTGNAVHTVSLVKRTEPFFGIGQFQGFQLSARGTLLPLPPRSTRRLEVIGDSISCGYGDEAKDQHAHFSSTTENAYLSYGAVAARLVGAEYVCSAWSGRLMWPTNTMDSVYGMTLPTVPGSTWDFAQWVPQAVVISLGTNDFNGKIPDNTAWEHGYEAFLARVRKNYPQAILYVASSPMLWGDKNTVERADLHQIVQDENATGDKKVLFLDIPTQDGAANGFGADWHPSVKTQALMAQVVAAALAKDLGWNQQTEGQ